MIGCCCGCHCCGKVVLQLDRLLLLVRSGSMATAHGLHGTVEGPVATGRGGRGAMLGNWPVIVKIQIFTQLKYYRPYPLVVASKSSIYVCIIVLVWQKFTTENKMFLRPTGVISSQCL